jgi:hypothetical protein
VGLAVACVGLFTVVPSLAQTTPPRPAGFVAPSFRPVYWLGDVGSANAPRLNAAQRRWVSAILAVPYWRHRERHLWFTPLPSDKHPLIVFYAEEWTLHQGRDHTGEQPNGNSGYYVVGEGCGSLFVRYTGAPPMIIPPPNDSAFWPDGCYHDPLVPGQSDASMHPPIPPDAPY